MIDMIPGADGIGFVPHPGGAVFNTSIALGRLGVQTSLLTGLSTDMFGRQLHDALQASHVDTRYLSLSDRPSTLAFVQLIDGHASYSFFDENSAGRMLLPQDCPEIGHDVSALFFGGISLACEPCADTYAALMTSEATNRAVMLDPNIRPSFIADIDRYRARMDCMLPLCDIVKLSDEDLGWLIPSPLSLTEKVTAILGRGPSMVILTRGGDGATGYLANGTEMNVPAQRVQIADTVGAGDTFNAGVLAKLSESGALRKVALHDLSPDLLSAALEHGAKVASITVSRSGANPPWSDELRCTSKYSLSSL